MFAVLTLSKFRQVLLVQAIFVVSNQCEFFVMFTILSISLSPMVNGTISRFSTQSQITSISHIFTIRQNAEAKDER